MMLQTQKKKNIARDLEARDRRLTVDLLHALSVLGFVAEEVCHHNQNEIVRLRGDGVEFVLAAILGGRNDPSVTFESELVEGPEHLLPELKQIVQKWIEEDLAAIRQGASNCEEPGNAEIYLDSDEVADDEILSAEEFLEELLTSSIFPWTPPPRPTMPGVRHTARCPPRRNFATRRVWAW